MNEQQRKNTLIIKSVLEKKIAENFDPRYLDTWESSCGTYRCVGGDVFTLMYPESTIFKPLTSANLLLGVDPWNPSEQFTDFEYNFQRNFGFSQEFGIVLSGEGGDVFGIEEEGTLQERLDYINKQLGEEL